MRKLYLSLILLLASCATAQTVTLSASHFGALAPATRNMYWWPVLSNGTPTSYQVDGVGQAQNTPIIIPVVPGVLTGPVPDTDLRAPQNLCFKITFEFSTGGSQTLGAGYDCAQPAANNPWCADGVCNFDDHTPNLAPLVMLQSGPTGSQGQGPAGTDGITALTGDGAANGPGSAIFTLATVNPQWGSCGHGTHVCQISTDGKGRIVGQTAVAISVTGGEATDLSNLAAPTAINDTTLTFAGAAGLTAGGTNQPVSLAPSGTGAVVATSNFQDKAGQVVNAKAYGALCNGASHPLSGYYSTLAAAQAVYPFIISLTQQLDYAALKAAANVAFGPDGSEHATNTALNVPLYLPAGTCNFGSDELLIRNADGIVIQGAGKTATVLEGSGIVLGFDGLWYSKLSDFEVITTSSSATVAIDVDGNVPGHPYSTRSVQGNLLQNILASGGNSLYALAFCRQGSNNAQCSENTFVNLHLSNASNSALWIDGFNALDNVWVGGDVQAYGKNGIYLSNSTLKEIGVSFEPAPGCGQLNNGGADIYATGGVGGSEVAIGSRTEGFSFLHASSTNVYVTGFTQNAALNNWAANNSVTLNEATEQSGSDGKKHLYCATTPGTSGLVAPTWPATGTVSDGTAVWTTTPFNAITFGNGTVDYSSSFIDPAASVTPGSSLWQLGSWNAPDGAHTGFIGNWTGTTTSELYMQSQGVWQSFFANAQPITQPSHYQPTLSLPASSAGVIAPSGYGFTVATTLKAYKAAITTSAVPTISGCGTISNQIGGGLAGTFQTDSTSCTPTLNGLPVTTTGYACMLWDQTHPTNPIGNVSSTTTSATFGTLSTTASDVIAFQCGLSY